MPASGLKEVRVVTHSGSFHPDDVFAVAVLVILFEKKFAVQIIERSRDPKIWGRADFLVDVGRRYSPESNLFDHHQVGGAGERPNGAPYASFGLVWKKFGDEICAGDAVVATEIDKAFVQSIDALDNGIGELKPVMDGVYPYSIGRAVLSLNPSWRDERPDFDKAFGQAVDFAVPVLRRAIAEARDFIEGERLARISYEAAVDKRIVVLDYSYPADNLFSNLPEPLYIVEPAFESANEVSWRLKTVRDNPQSFVNRRDLPAAWAGKCDEELVVASGVPDAIFCHTKRFVAYAKTKEGAMTLAKLALEMQN